MMMMMMLMMMMMMMMIMIIRLLVCALTPAYWIHRNEKMRLYASTHITNKLLPR